MENKLVVRFLNGNLIKGYSNNFQPEKNAFHITTLEGDVKEIRVDQCKAVFFVKTFDGNSGYEEERRFNDPVPSGYRKIRVEFNDGERLVGKSITYRDGRPWFFLEPADPKSNNDRIYIPMSSVRDLRVALY
ncbi:MAG: hypothetical protein GXP49_18095 [Deltaproteobacteria bacterium]|nr:hypothetical protein [Deltaproteobacteria bacterium]